MSSLRINFFSCSAGTAVENNVIKINLHSDTIFAVKIKKIVLLDSRESGIIGGAERISHLKKNILIFDSRYRNSFFLYDSSGTYLISLQSGKGPYEIINPADYSIYKNEVYILDNAQKKMIVTDFDLNPIRENRVNVFGRYFEILNNENWLFYTQSPGFDGNTSYSFMLYSHGLNKQLEKMLKLQTEELRRVRLGNTISREDYTKVFCRPFDQNIYSFNDSGLKIEYFLDFGAHNVSSEEIDLGLLSVYEKMRNGERISTDGRLIHNEDFLLVRLHIGEGLNI